MTDRLLTRITRPGLLAASLLAPALADTLHVDPVCGDDSWTGENATCNPVGFGPKRTFSAALSAASSGDRIRLLEGVHSVVIGGGTSSRTSTWRSWGRARA